MPDALNDQNLDPGTGPARSLLLNQDGDFAFIGGHMVLARGPVAIAQEIRNRCKFWLGESFTDVTVGIDFLNEVFTKPPNIPAAQAAFRREILATAGVASIEESRAEYISEERRLSLYYRARLADGSVIEDTFTTSGV